MMKQCPVCKTNVFSDMDTCYGCMYKFGSNTELEEKAESAKKESLLPSNSEESLFGHFLIEYEGFLRDFLVNSKIKV